MSLHISNDDVRNVLGQSVNLPRDNLWIGAGRKSLKVLSGALPSVGLMGLMSYSGGYDRRGTVAS